jgi:hypothetical protein
MRVLRVVLVVGFFAWLGNLFHGGHGGPIANAGGEGNQGTKLTGFEATAGGPGNQGTRLTGFEAYGEGGVHTQGTRLTGFEP